MSRVVMNFARIFIICCQVISVFSAKFDGVEVGLIKDETYIELHDFMQVVIPQYRKLNNTERCSTKCNSNQFNSNKKNEVLTTHSSNSKCIGKVTNCVPLKSTLCFNNNPKLYVDHDSGKLLAVDDDRTIYGKQLGSFTSPQPNMCDNNNREIYKTCPFCMCDCIAEKKDSGEVRSFSLRDLTSNITHNMVVTGLKLVRSDETIHIEIEQSQLAANYKIETKTTQWISNATITNITTELMTLEANRRTVYLDDITLPNDRVFTGVRFKKYDKEALGIEIRGTKVNWKTGKLVTTDNLWYDSGYMAKNKIKPYGPNEKRTPIPLEDLLDSLLAPENTQISETNKLLKFTTTSRKRMLGYSTIPYFFGKEITEVKPATGAGLTYKTAKGFGGFIALKMIHNDSSTKYVSSLLTYMIISIIVFPLKTLYL